MLLTILILDLIGTFIFALTGAIKGIDKHLDMFGITVLASVVGVGGGIFRDCCIGALPVAAFTNQYYLIICILTGLIVFVFKNTIKKHRSDKLILYLDAIGLGVFTSLGSLKAISYGVPFIGVVIAGVFTAIGGGLIRDIFTGDSPPVVLKTDLYATASLFGGIICYVMNCFAYSANAIFIVVSLFVFLLRILAIKFKLQLPKA